MEFEEEEVHLPQPTNLRESVDYLIRRHWHIVAIAAIAFYLLWNTLVGKFHDIMSARKRYVPTPEEEAANREAMLKSRQALTERIAESNRRAAEKRRLKEEEESERRRLQREKEGSHYVPVSSRSSVVPPTSGNNNRDEPRHNYFKRDCGPRGG